jgi:hypothetical protein
MFNAFCRKVADVMVNAPDCRGDIQIAFDQLVQHVVASAKTVGALILFNWTNGVSI